jgi:hypothetical protein
VTRSGTHRTEQTRRVVSTKVPMNSRKAKGHDMSRGVFAALAGAKTIVGRSKLLQAPSKIDAMRFGRCSVASGIPRVSRDGSAHEHMTLTTPKRVADTAGNAGVPTIVSNRRPIRAAITHAVPVRASWIRRNATLRPCRARSASRLPAATPRRLRVGRPSGRSAIGDHLCARCLRLRASSRKAAHARARRRDRRQGEPPAWVDRQIRP